MSKVWRGTPGDRAMLAVSKRHLRTRIATLSERDQAGIPRDEPAHALAIKTCQGVLVTAMPDRASKASFAMIANALSIRWERPFAEVAQAIGALLAADDEVLSDLSTALITSRATCSKATCSCGAQFAPLVAGMLSTDDAQAGEAFADLKAIRGTPTPEQLKADRIQQDVATMKILAGMRQKMGAS